MTRRRIPAASEARLAMRASVGPIFPATPSRIMSPSIRPSVSITPGVGALSKSSSWSIVMIDWAVTSSKLKTQSSKLKAQEKFQIPNSESAVSLDGSVWWSSFAGILGFQLEASFLYFAGLNFLYEQLTHSRRRHWRRRPDGLCAGFSNAFRRHVRSQPACHSAFD